MKNLIKHAKESGTSEGRLIAEFVEDLVDDGADGPLIEASVMALSEWADMFRRKAIDQKKKRK